MKEKSIVMKMLFEKLKAAFGGVGCPSYKISIDAKTDIINVADSDYEYEPIVFKVTYNEAFDSFYYTGDNIDSSILRALVNIENAIEEEYPYPEEIVEYSVYVSVKNDPDAYEPWCTFNTLEDTKSQMDELKPRFPDRDFYILKTTTIEEKVIL